MSSVLSPRWIPRRIALPTMLLMALLMLPVSPVGHAVHRQSINDLVATYAAADKARQLACLAINIYHEGRGESVRGQAAIASVTMNRVRSKQYPDTVCKVVWQYKQFSWTLLAPRHLVVNDHAAWQKAELIAELFLNGARITQVGDSMHYHSVDVQPHWGEPSRLIALIGGHLFYAPL